jgi:pimeloyl-ACP methyl ester carboxylesterase
MAHIETDGIKLHFEDYGRGYPIIFVHEFESDLRSWEAQIRYFARTYRCVAYNARGYPPSDIPENPALYGWEFSVRDIAAVMHGLSISRAHVIGSSMGAYAALMFGLRYPQQVSAIVAAGAGSGSPPSDRETWLKNTPVVACTPVACGMEPMAERTAQHSTRNRLKYKDPLGWHEFLEQLRRHSARGTSNTMMQCQAKRPSLYDCQDQFAKMGIPVLLAVGDEDEPCLQANVMLKSWIPAAGLWMCPNTGHAIHMEEPALFNTEVEKFLSAVERGNWSRRDLEAG